MNMRNILLSAILLGASASAFADAGGKLYHNGNAIELKGAYAFASQSHFDKNQQTIILVLSDTPIDAASIDAASDRAEALRSYLDKRKATSVKLELNTAAKDHPLEMIGLDMDAYHSSGSMGSDFYALDLKQADAKRIEGTFRSKHEADKTSKHDDYYDLHFALNVASGPAFGAGLPPDGGEPFKAYKAYGDALWDARHEKFGALSEATAKAPLDRLIATQKKDPKSFKKVIDKMWDEHMNSNVEFMQGSVKGDVATLDIKGRFDVYTYDADNNQVEKRTEATSTVTMKKEDGAWRFDKEVVKKSDNTVTSKP